MISIPVPPNNNQQICDFYKNIYFERDLISRINLDNGKKSNISSKYSEDAVTWNFILGLLSGGNEALSNHNVLSQLGFTSKDSIAFLWNRCIFNEKYGTRISDALIETINCIEANTRSSSEIDVIIFNHRMSALTFVEAKLNSGPGICKAVRSTFSFDATRDNGRIKGGECRLFRKSKSPRENGCSYWGDGFGGEEFRSRFKENYVSKFFTFDRPNSPWKKCCFHGALISKQDNFLIFARSRQY